MPPRAIDNLGTSGIIRHNNRDPKPQQQIACALAATAWTYDDLWGITGKSPAEIEGLELRMLERPLYSVARTAVQSTQC